MFLILTYLGHLQTNSFVLKVEQNSKVFQKQIAPISTASRIL